MATTSQTNYPPMKLLPGAAPRLGSKEQAHSGYPRDTVFGEEPEACSRQLAFLAEVNCALAGEVDIKSSLAGILTQLAKREHLSHARIYRLDEAAGELCRMAWGGRDGVPQPVISLRDTTLAPWTVRQREAVYVSRVENDPRYRGFKGEERSAYAVPLRTGSRIQGVLEVATAQREGIPPVTRKLIDQIATQAALALERSELRKRVRLSEERFRAIFEQIRLGVGLVSLSGNIIAANPAFAALLGYTCEELRGKRLDEITDQNDPTANQKYLQSLLQNGSGAVNIEKRYLRKSGESIWCTAGISLLHDAAGQPAYFLGTMEPISDRRKDEEERNRLQQQLFQAQKMEALGTLAGGIAHDFNNLLSVMMGFASLARQRLSSDDPLQDSMGMIEESARRAAELTRQIVGFARPELQQVKAAGVDDVLKRVRRMVERTFDRNIAVTVRHGDSPLWVNAEPSYLEQALLNLCINARDAMPQGGTLTLEAAETTVELPEAEKGARTGESKRRFVDISVQDTGTGIAPDALDRVFEPFYTTKPAGRGTGLGLAMVHGFVKNHEGFVKVKSQVGHGACFTMSLPQVSHPRPQKAPVGIGQVEPGRGTVPVVDDEPLIRAFAMEGLKALGYQVMVAENGKQALATYRQHHPAIDSVLMDLVMPEMGGLETYRQMRAENPAVCVIFASGYSTGGILSDDPEASSAAFIAKPYTLAGLSVALRNAGIGQPRKA